MIINASRDTIELITEALYFRARYGATKLSETNELIETLDSIDYSSTEPIQLG